MSTAHGLWIAPEIWQSTDLNLVEKVLLADISALSSNDLVCFKTNETLASDLGVSVSTVKRSLARLIQTGMVEVAPFNGRKRELRTTGRITPLDVGQSEPAQSDPVHTEPGVGQSEPGVGHTEPGGGSHRPARIQSRVQSKIQEKTQHNEVLMPFEDFADIWAEWKEYKRAEHGFKYKTKKTEQTALHQLQKLSNDDRETARQIIAQSIANGWKGLFEFRGKTDRAITGADRDELAEYIRGGSI